MPSIFDEAGAKRPASPKSSSHPPIGGAVPFGDAKSTRDVDHLIENPGSIKLQDVDNIIVRLHEIHDDIERKLDDIYQKSGLTPNYIKDYLSNPNNFAPQQWEQVQRDRQALLGSLMGATKVESMDDKEKKTAQVIDKSAKDRRGKMIGTRKNWIPMQ